MGGEPQAVGLRTNQRRARGGGRWSSAAQVRKRSGGILGCPTLLGGVVVILPSAKLPLSLTLAASRTLLNAPGALKTSNTCMQPDRLCQSPISNNLSFSVLRQIPESLRASWLTQLYLNMTQTSAATTRHATAIVVHSGTMFQRMNSSGATLRPFCARMSRQSRPASDAENLVSATPMTEKHTRKSRRRNSSRSRARVCSRTVFGWTATSRRATRRGCGRGGR